MEIDRQLYFLPLLLLLLVAGLLLWESHFLRTRNRPYPWREIGVSVAIAAIRRLLLLTLFGGIALAVLTAAHGFRLFDIVVLDEGRLAPWALLALFLGVEFCYYWQHRSMHQVRWWWADHSVHHSPNRLALLVAERLGWFTPIAGSIAFFIPLCLLGFSPRAVLAMVSLNLAYQFWLHTEAIGKLGWLEWIFNTPSHHRVHHAANPCYLDANYGGVLIIYDRLFGTFIEESAGTPVVFGLVTPQRSANPFVVATAEWRSILADAKRHWRSPALLLRYLFKAPGWSHDGSRLTSAMIKEGLNQVPQQAGSQPATP